MSKALKHGRRNDGSYFTSPFTNDFEINDYFLEYVRTYVSTDANLSVVSLTEEGVTVKCVWAGYLWSNKWMAWRQFTLN